jgi:TetR/AcrR family transcriptional repressor of nem operon
MSHETRERLVRRGVEMLTEFSVGATGLDRLLRSAGVTKGSFYHFFGSKQAFTLAVIDAYEAYFEARFERILGDRQLSPVRRMRHWIDEAVRGMARHGFRRGCLVGNLSQELGPHDAVLRERLRAVFERWEGWVRQVLEEARACGELRPGADPARLATAFLTGWQGAILRAKLEGRAEPMEAFASFFLDAVTPADPPACRGAR